MRLSFFKRTVVMLLAVALLLCCVPPFTVSAAKSGSVTVSVATTQVTINVDGVGNGGTATVYRVAANEYLQGDALTGKSKDIVTAGDVVGTYSCGTKQSFVINRYLKDGSDNLYDKYYVVQGNNILYGPVYATEIASARKIAPFKQISKKGLTAEDYDTVRIAKEMGATNTVVNMDLSTLIFSNEDMNGNPRDLSKRNDVIEFVSNGKTYYFNNEYVKQQDGMISAYSKAGINVSLVLITWAKTLTGDYPAALKYYNQTNRQTLAFNTSNALGMDYWIAAIEFIANRYSQSENLGLVDKFIVGNEIDYTYDWYLLEPLAPKNGSYKGTAVDMDVFMEEYSRTLRLANMAVKKYNSEAKVCVSLTHNWAMNSAEAYKSDSSSVRWNSYRPKEIVDWLVKNEGARGDYNWGLAVHPYAVGTNTSNPLAVDPTGVNGLYHPATGDPDTTPWITVSNLEVYQLYLQRPENRYNGQIRTVSMTETTVLSEKSTSANYAKSVREQAASIAMTYYRAANLECVDQIAYFQPHDQTTTSYMVGLMTSSGVMKPAYNVWKYIDTNKGALFANKYLKYISSTAKSYKDLMPAVKSDFDWDAAWKEENMVVRTVETGDTNRTLSPNKTVYNSNDPILVTATGDVGDTVELFLASDDPNTAMPLYSYPVMGTQNGKTFVSGGTYNMLAYSDFNTSRGKDVYMKAGEYKLVLRRGDTESLITKNITIASDYNFGSTAFNLTTDKNVYESGEDIIVSATGSRNSWVGLYKKGNSPGQGESILWYWNNWEEEGYLSGKPTVLQSANRSGNDSVLEPGDYVLYLFEENSSSSYNVKKRMPLVVTAAEIQPLTGATYTLDNQTDGFANGTVTVTKDSKNGKASACIMYWADSDGKPLEGYTGLGKFRLSGVKTEYRMPDYTVIPNGAAKLLVYASDGYSLSNEAIVVDLPAGCTYDLSEKANDEFQVISDIHVTTDSGATGEVKLSNAHFQMMLEDVKTNSPDSLGIFINGDIANTGSAAEFNKVLSMWMAAKNNGLKQELHLSIGNHDWMAGNPAGQFQKYASVFNSNLTAVPSKVYYDEVVDGYHFIYLGGEQAGLRANLSAEQLEWFDNRLAEIYAEDPNQPVFVLLHQSFYNTVAGSLPGQGWDGVVNETALKKVMEKYGNIILFNGHSHWELNSERNAYGGDTQAPAALNTASLGYLWTSYNIAGGEFMDGTHGYYLRVYDDKVVILGRDFENGLFLPSATYVFQRNQITTDQDAYDLAVDQTAVNLNAKPASNTPLHYLSSDNDVVTVTEDGTLIAKAPGEAVITVTAEATNTHLVSKRSVTVSVAEDKTQYTVTFKNWDGSVLSTKAYNLGDTVEAPQVPNRSGYTFTGWDKPITVCNGDAVYTAQFSANLNGVLRVAGATRYDTAFAAADMLKETMGVSQFQNIVVACGTDFADALSGSYLANQKAAPILLVKGSSVSAVKDYIKANLVPGGTVYLLGGEKAVSNKMDTGLEGFNVKRLAGSTRYATNLEILKEAGVGSKDILVCTGKEFADGLSASAVNLPVLLVKDSLNEDQKAFLDTCKGNKIYIIGGKNAVNTRIEDALKSYSTPIRIEGATRYHTSVSIAQTFFPNANSMILASGQNFPDGLSGGPVGSSLNAPMILTADGKQSKAVEYATQNNITSGVILGGVQALKDNTVRQIFRLSNDAEIQVK